MNEEDKRKGLSRRDFIKGTAAGAGAAAFLGLGSREARASRQMTRVDEEADVVVVGSGFAGLAAAIEAREAGASVKVIEKMPIEGGNSRINGGLVAAVDSPKQRAKGIKDSVELYMKDLLKAGRGLNHPDLVEFLGKNTWPAVEWSIKHLGVEYKDTLTQLGGHSVPRSYMTSQGTGWGIVKKQLEKLESLGVKVNTGRKLISILQDEKGGVQGIKVLDGFVFGEEGSGREMYIKANKAVVLASGGFGHDIKMRTDQQPELDESVESTNQPGATGEALREALRAGANPIQLSWIQLGPWACPEEKGFGIGPGFAALATAIYGIWIDPKNGKRFVNELADRRTRAQAELKVGKEPEYPVAVTDSAGAAKEGKELLKKQLEKGIVYKFEKLGDLAEFFGIPGKSLREQVDEYNSYVEQGEDKQFGKPVHEEAEPLRNPPWYAMRLWPKAHHTMGGIEIDTDANVYDLEGIKIKGLYAAGEVAGGIHGGCRLGSCAVSDCLVYGRVAGAVAAGASNPYKK